MEKVPQDVWNVTAKCLSQKDRSSARTTSRFFFKKMTPEWDRFSRARLKICAIVAGTYHSLLLTESGELWGCGDNRSGQLGLGDKIGMQPEWVRVIDKISIQAIAVGSYNSLLLSDGGELFGCGNNDFGQLGFELSQKQMSWISLYDKVQIRTIEVKARRLLLTETGKLWRYGSKLTDQLGLGHFQPQKRWIQLSDEINIRAIAAGENHGLLLSDDGELFGCGEDMYGQLGLGDNTKSQATWVKLTPFPYAFRLEELIRQRTLVFMPVSLKTVLALCDALFLQLLEEEEEEKQLALFSEMKSLIPQQLTEPLPEPWAHELEHLYLLEFKAFYGRLREHFNLEPVDEAQISLSKSTKSLS